MKKIYLSLIALFCAINFSYAQWSTLGSDIYYNTGNVGIGTGPTSRLTVSGGGATFGQYSTTVNNDGVLSIGDATNNFTPSASNWNTTGSNLIFNGGGYSTIAFWNADNRVDFIRTGNRTIQLGYDGGWGTANVGFTNGIWDINGNVGIGTTTPLSPLHVNGDIRISAGSGGQLIFADGSTMSSASLGSAASLSNLTDAIITSNSGAGGTGDVILKTASAERLRVLNSNGNVGIGTSSPNTKLQVAGEIKSGIVGTSGSIGVARSSDGVDIGNLAAEGSSGLRMQVGGGGSYMAFQTNSVTDAVRIIDNGNVGIGTTSPTERLDIGSGNMTTSGYVEINTSAKNQLVFGSSGANYGFVSNNATGVWSLGYGATPATLGTPALSWNSNGNIGIGTTAPAFKLDVQGGNASVYNTGTESQLSIGSLALGKTHLILASSADAGGYGIIQSVSVAGSTYGNTVINPSGGNILIGQTSQVNSAYKLDVAGYVRANEIVVNTSGADFVFDAAYKLNSISTLKKYIDKNHHLPEIPSAKQMEVDGLSVGENQTKLLQKVEELTLYVIQLKEENTALKQTQQKINKKLSHYHLN